MNLREAKDLMRHFRILIGEYKEERKRVTEKINRYKDEIQSIKGQIFRGEIKWEK